MTTNGTIIADKYEVLKEIGRGGMSIVYLAMDKNLNKQWAVKEIRKKGSGKNDEIVVNSLLAEANMMKKLDHPALPRIVDIIDNGTTIYVIMDYIEGESLDKVLNEYGAQPEELVIGWAKQLCDALSYLHSQKPPIIYRDMKPANVMLKPEGNIKIIDFGIAREYKEQNLADTTVLGTKGYAPPEQYSGQTDARSDIFALGMTMHHLLTGVDPRNGEAYVSVRQWNPELSDGIEAIIDKCVEPAAENRYQNCAELLYDLEHPQEVTRDYKRKQQRKLLAFIVSVVLCVLGLISGFGCSVKATQMNESTYKAYVDIVESSALEVKVDSYKNAIEMDPTNPEAYIKLLEAYEYEGKFTKEDNDEFSAVYKKDNFDITSADVATLNYKAGELYFNYYVGATGEESFVERVRKAYPFFAENYNNRESIVNYENQTVSDCYYQICSFYQKYVYSLSVDEASKSDYENLFEIINETVETLENTDDARQNDRLSLYHAVFMFLYDQRDTMVSVNMEQTVVVDMLTTIYEKAKLLTPQKESAQKLKDEIVDKYDKYKDAIERKYKNAEERR